MQLAPSALQSGFRFELHPRLGSTNDEAMARAREGDPGRLWIVARRQTKGRGRHGRDWVSPSGNLYASLLLIDACPAAMAPQLGFVAGVALAETVSDLARHDRRLALKWPNDLLFAGAKLAGILLEGARVRAGFACVLGFGVNCGSHPQGLSYPATDLASFSRVADPGALFERLSSNVLHWLDVWDQGRGFSRVRRTWLSFAGGLGERIRVHGVKSGQEGFFRGLDEEGRLLLDTGQGLSAIDAGDVFLATSPGEAAQLDVRS
ncbi:MAG TPA: biotin--[acetyl-CoA-carboxylase] ligase [Beijerinckiaceae bacterium]|nr:biotin--[acetyl-CoA-carboxylase] ligase [Beijerinckiaceae bacterium]